MSELLSTASIQRERMWLCLWALVLLTCAMVLNTQSNTFPFFYHLDEGGKVRQVMTGEWNYHHPMLLLGATKLVADRWPAEQRAQAVVEMGRWVSAGFTGAAIVALALLAYLWRGWAASFCAGGALLTHHQLFELSHYMKEDTALLLGVATTLLTAFAFHQKPTAARAAWMGLAAALAISGKYVGAVMLLGVLPLIWRASEGEGRKARGVWLAWFFGVLLGTLLVVNLPLVLHSASSGASLGREMELVVHGQGEMTRRVPHSQYWNVFRDNTTPMTWVLLLAFLFARWRERRRLGAAEWLVIAFPFAFALLLSFSPKSNDRYFLPATGVLMVLASIGVVDAARWVKRWIPTMASIAVLGAALVGAQIPSWLKYENAFQHDDTAELIEWVRTMLPPSAVIAKDNRVRLPESPESVAAERFGRIPQTVLAGKFAADLGTIAELRARGVTYVAVSESDYGKFFLKSLRPKKSDVQAFAKRKAFYQELRRDGELLFERERSTVIYLHPGIRVYRLPEF